VDFRGFVAVVVIRPQKVADTFAGQRGAQIHRYNNRARRGSGWVEIEAQIVFGARSYQSTDAAERAERFAQVDAYGTR